MEKTSGNFPVMFLIFVSFLQNYLVSCKFNFINDNEICIRTTKWKFEQNMTKEKLVSRFLITFCQKFNSGLTALDVEPFITLIVATVGSSAGIMSTSRLLSHQLPFWDNTGIYADKSLLSFYILYCTIFIIVCCRTEAV